MITQLAHALSILAYAVLGASAGGISGVLFAQWVNSAPEK